jgi:hypothetical protein
MSDVFDIPRADHREVQQMLAELETGPAPANRVTPIRPEARTDRQICTGRGKETGR